MLKRYFLNSKKRNFSIASIWIKGGSDMDSSSKKGVNKILCSLLTRGCEGFNNITLSEYIESYGAELNQEVFEDGISISIKCLNEHFSKLFPLLDLIIKCNRGNNLLKCSFRDLMLIKIPSSNTS